MRVRIRRFGELRFTRPASARRGCRSGSRAGRIHKARQARKTLAALGGRIVLHFLPPYCPDANRIERVWQDFHANVTRNHRCGTMSELLGNVRDYVDAYRWRRAAGVRALLRSVSSAA